MNHTPGRGYPPSSGPPSIASTRPPSSASTRPSSSLSLRPPSSASMRPSSSASSVRPSTSASMRPSSSASYVRQGGGAPPRPTSRMTQRPSSRFSQRFPLKQNLRLVPLYQDLVSQLTSLTSENDEDNFRLSVDFVSKNLDPTVKPALRADLDVIEKQVRGHSQKARIVSEDILAEALSTAFTRLKTHSSEIGNDLDAIISASQLPNHVQFLLQLSTPPSKATLSYADNYMELVRNPPQPPPSLTWKDILAEEPFEGQHWQGAYGLPPGSTVENWESESDGSMPSLSALDDLDDIGDSTSSDSPERIHNSPPSSPPAPLPPIVNVGELPPEPNHDHRAIVEELQARQYWREGWRINAAIERPFSVGDVSTFEPAFRRALALRTDPKVNAVLSERYIQEHDAVREILMGLQGRQNLMLAWADNGERAHCFVPASDAPSVLHLTTSALNSILGSFATTATNLEHLRKFVANVFNHSIKETSQNIQSTRLSSQRYRSTQTLEAFAESVDFQIRQFDSWCASREEQLCMARGGVGPPLVLSFLSLEVAIRNKFSGTFSVLQEMLARIIQQVTRSFQPVPEFWTVPDLPQRMSPSAVTTLLLDSLLLKVIEHASMADNITSQNLMEVFIGTTDPLWKMIGRWVGDGMPVRDMVGTREAQLQHLPSVADEFFIEDNELPLLDPDFWSDGFSLRETHEVDEIGAVPLFLRHAATHILSAGKAVGLLRALGLSSALEHTGHSLLSQWPSLSALLQNDNTNSPAVSMSIDDFSRLVYDELTPPCKAAQAALTRVLLDDCDLWHHLSAMEDLLLMRRGDAISNLIDVFFARMDSHLPWTDFHFLNTAFRDVVEQGRTPWVDPSLVRFSHRGKDKNIGRTVRAIEGLLIEYAIPFPLTYLFSPRMMQVYSSIFVLVLQVRRAKSALERILVRGAVGSASQIGGDLKVFYAMRGKLSWFINVFLNFISTNVLHTQLAAFHHAFRGATSLDEMIASHNEHLNKLEGRCLLLPNTAALHRAIMAILDMCLHFSDCFVAFAGDTTHDISRQSLLHVKRHRSRRQKRQRKNVIGFSQSLEAVNEPNPSESSESESDMDEASMEIVPETSFSFDASAGIDFTEESFQIRLDKMSSELDALVRFIRRGVESLAGGASEAAPAFGIFAFALEDWDR